MSNTFDKLSVLDSFIEEVNSYLPEIETNLERLAQSPDDMEALEETYRRTHTIGGSASMMDFPGLSHVAHGMEDILGDALDGVTPMDAPTLGLLQRSLGRLHQLVDGIRGNIDQEAIMAQDDADYTQYRLMADTRGASGYHRAVVQEQAQVPQAQTASAMQQVPTFEPSISSFDEMLASFRTPSVAEGQEIDWPEDPVPVSHFAEPTAFALQPDVPAPPAPQFPPPSALDMLVATTRNVPAYTAPLTEYSALPVMDMPVEESPALVDAAPVISGKDEMEPATSLILEAAPQEPVSVLPVRPPADVAAVPDTDNHDYANLAYQAHEREQPDLPAPFSRVYDDLHEETRSLEDQVTSLKNTVSQLRLAVNVIELQRAEFRGFLDGSRDALDRMEDWAGQAMGLNLRNSPEQVRRYLPLSVMWVANSKLKKILDLLARITGGVEVTDEQMGAILAQLKSSVESCGEVFQRLQSEAASAYRPAQEAGWTPWETQAARDAENVRESVTFERRGDYPSLRAEVEVKVREDLQREYENRPSTLAARMELEQQIREEVRKEFEAKQQLQEKIIGFGQGETYQELEMRLRNDVEIQVRREFLAQITSGALSTGMAAPSQSAMPSTLPPPDSMVGMAGQIVDVALPQFSSVSVPQASEPNYPTAAAPARSRSPLDMGDFGEEAAEIFRLEAEEHLQTISIRVAALEKSPNDRDLLQGIRRATHTLKGAAGMMGFRAIAEVCHVSEDLLDSIMEGAISITPPVLSIILDTAEILDRLINNRDDEGGSVEEILQTLRNRYIDLLGVQGVSPLAAEEELDADIDLTDAATVAGTVADAQPGETAAQRVARGDLSVRVRLQKLDELVNLFGELLVNRSVLEERVQRLVRLVGDVGVSSNRLRDVGQKLESRFEAATLPSGHSIQVMPGNGSQALSAALANNNKNLLNRSEPSHLAEFDELELDRYTEFHQMARGLSEGISDMTTLSSEMEAIIRECEGIFARESRLNGTFQDRLMKARLVPLSSMIPRLYRTVRSVALKQHKEIDFLAEGEATEVDRTVYEEIAGPLLHLMRNAVNHAIESPQMRVQKGKSPTGQIKLSAAYEGNQVVITVRDDGAGLDPDRIRHEAITRGLIRADQTLSPNDVIDLIFRPGFSTSEVLSEESGRGVGLDVVRDSVARLRGALEVDSTPGLGTAFTMKFPTSLAIQGAMMVRAASQQFAIPTVVVESIGRLDNFKQSTFGGRPAVQVQNDLYPLTPLAQLLKLPVSPIDAKAPLLLINTGRHRVALVVDDIKGKMDVVMKNLGPHLRHVQGIAGGTVLGNGRVVLILELPELLATQSRSLTSVAGTITSYREGVLVPPVQPTRPMASVPGDTHGTVSTAARPPAMPAAPTKQEHGKHVLVVDDSPSVRRVVSNMLKQHAWEVQMARDGVEALEMITHETPAAVLLDIEMPRMDGYELMATVRAQEQYRTLPLVVLTSRAAAKHQQRAMQLGASAYIVKPYQDEELITTLNSLVYGATV
ncbi:MAG: Hpt domain-containing protein [Ktedonobacteraceae bacterium]